ncbi:Serine/threonine-protein kinase [Sorochytrium milnesiophthora]
MGNKLSHSFSPPYTVESLVAELSDWVTIGGARFMKTVRGRLHDGHPVTIKVFVRPDAGFSVDPYVRDTNDELARLQHLPNVCPYHRVLVHEKAVFMLRQYILSNLYDRISTRPFLSLIEKKWIAFQLLSALSQAHSRNVYHGDIKSENVLVTSWNWALLADFASFKPTMLPEDNPTDFSFFFDISSRRTCYIAPERFMSDSAASAAEDGSPASTAQGVAAVRYAELTEAMDVFSMGCVLAELFLEGTVIFDLSQLLRYKRNDYDPRPQLEHIQDADITEMICNMIHVDPLKRSSANDLLKRYRDRIFPGYFSSFLHGYILSVSESQAELLNMQAHYLGSPGHRRPSESDVRVQRIFHDFDKIAFALNLSAPSDSAAAADAALLLLNILCANVRSLVYPSSKLFVLSLLHKLGALVDDEHKVDRVMPYVVFLLQGTSAVVRASGLAQVGDASAVDVNMFSDYILPCLRPLVTDTEPLVRAAYAQQIAALAETSVRFVELSQYAQEEAAGDDPDWQADSMADQACDVVLADLQEAFQEHVTMLLTDADSSVKRCLLSVITRLCIFFGKQKANDFLLSHMITYLNDRDASLRSAFFDAMASAGAVIGDRSLADYILPLMTQSLSGMELDETVIERILNSLSVLGELGLLGKLKMREIVAVAMPYVYHPNLSLRYAVVAMLVSFAKQLATTDALCFLSPNVRPYLRTKIYDMDELTLLEALDSPVERATLQTCVAAVHNNKELLDLLASSSDAEQLRNGLMKCINDESSTRKLVKMAGIVHKLAQQSGSSSTTLAFKVKDEIRLRELKVSVNTVFLTPDMSGAGSQSSRRKRPSERSLRIPKTQSYPTLRQSSTAQIEKHASDSQLDVLRKSDDGTRPAAHRASVSEGVKSSSGSKQQGSDGAERRRVPTRKASSSSLANALGLVKATAATSTVNATVTVAMSRRQSSGTVSLSDQKQQQQQQQQVAGVTPLSPLNEPLSDMWSTTYEFGAVSAKKIRSEGQKSYLTDTHVWRPEGNLVAHLAEHKGAVNQICVSPDSTFFASCSDDGTVKIWDCQRLVKNVTNQARLTYSRQGGYITCMTFIKDTHCIASASDLGSIHIFKVLLLGHGKYGGCELVRELQLDGEHALAIEHHQSESKSLLVYSTDKCNIYAWDFRRDEQAFCYVSALVVDRNGCWLLAGTSRGILVLWDIRFQLVARYWGHPSKARIHRLLLHPTLKQTVVVMGGRREVSLWNVDTAECRLVFLVREGKERPLDSYKALVPVSPTDFVQNALRAFDEAPANAGFQAIIFPPEQPYVLVTGATMKIHAWDLLRFERSSIIAGLDADEVQPKYSSMAVGNTTVHTETPQMRAPTKPGGAKTNAAAATRGNNGFSLNEPQALVNHLDAVLDMQLLTFPYPLVVTGGRDGVIKVWK